MKIVNDQGETIPQDSAALASFMDLLNRMLAFDKTRKSPYDLERHLHERTEDISRVTQRMNPAAPTNPRGMPMGNLIQLMRNFFGNMPGVMMTKKRVLDATDLYTLQEEIKTENMEREHMEKMELEWKRVAEPFITKNAMNILLLDELPAGAK